MATLSQPLEDPARPGASIEKPKRTRRGFGWVRKLPSGRYQASYLDPTGIRITAKGSEAGKPVPLTFLDKRTAEAWKIFLWNLRTKSSNGPSLDITKGQPPGQIPTSLCRLGHGITRR